MPPVVPPLRQLPALLEVPGGRGQGQARGEHLAHGLHQRGRQHRPQGGLLKDEHVHAGDQEAVHAGRLRDARHLQSGEDS